MPAAAPDRQASSASPPPVIATTILIPQDRIARQPLAPWAAELTRRLAATRRTVRRTHEIANELEAIGNMAGLIAASRGDMTTAWDLTQRHLWWHGRHARRSGDAAVGAHALQPWVNLGRLELLTGHWRDALARFAGLTAYPVTERLDLGCVRLTGSAWKTLMPSRDRFLAFLETVFVSDSLRAMLLNRHFELIHPFAARFTGSGGPRWICEEACVIAECRVGDSRAAAVRALLAARRTRGWHRAVFRLRAAEAYTCAGDRALAAGILEQLADAVAQLSDKRRADPKLMPITARLAGACQEAHLPESACTVARSVLQSARAACDEPVQIEMLRLLADTAPGDERQGFADAARHLEETTEYARYRRGGAPPPNPVITEMYARLEEAFSS